MSKELEVLQTLLKVKYFFDISGIESELAKEVDHTIQRVGEAWLFGENNTDPYGSLEYAIGSVDDFWCFDYAVSHDKKWIKLHAVINSETGGFIQDARVPMIVPVEYAVQQAQNLTEEALDWIGENEVPHDDMGWDQHTDKFLSAVKAEVEQI